MRRAFSFRLAVGGFLLVAVSHPVEWAVLRLSGGDVPSAVTAPLKVVGSACVIAAVILYVTQRLFVPAFVFAVLLAAGTLLNARQSLVHPESFFDFTTAGTTLVGAIVAAVGCATAAVQRRRNTFRPARTIERVLAWTGIGAIVAVGAVSLALTYSRRPNERAPRGSIMLEMRDTRFVPRKIEVKRGQHVRLYVVNEDAFAHTFTSEALGVDQYVGPRSQRLIDVDATPPEAADKGGAPVDRLDFSCVIAGHGAMIGAILVR